MITVFGDAVVSFVRDSDGRYHEEIRSYSYDVARSLIRYGVFPNFICGLGKDPVGSFVVEDMVEEGMMFDPDLCLLSSPSAVRIEDGDRILPFYLSTAMGAVDEQKLADALSVHSNIKCIHLSSFTLAFNPVGSSYLDLASFLSPRPFIASDIMKVHEGPVFSRHAAEAVAVSDLVRCTPETSDFAKAAKLAVLSCDGHTDVMAGGRAVKSIVMPGLRADDPCLSAFILSSLEKEGFFMEDGVGMSLYDPGAGLIEKILLSWQDR